MRGWVGGLWVVAACAGPGDGQPWFETDDAVVDSVPGGGPGGPGAAAGGGGPGGGPTDPPLGTDETDGGVVDGLTIAVSGSRLKRRVAEGTDGSEEFLGWWDSMLSTSCAYATATDGQLRCLPNPDVLGGDDVAYVSTYYRNASCTQPVYAASCPTLPTYFVAYEGTPGCAQRQAVVTPGAAYGGSSPVYQKSVAGCTFLANANQLAGLSLYQGTTVAPATFQQATVVLK